MDNNHNVIGTIASVFFAGMGWLSNHLDWSYADNVIIEPLQHLLSIGAYTVSILVGLPIAVKTVKKFFQYIKSIF